jgi:hypothetical protein
VFFGPSDYEAAVALAEEARRLRAIGADILAEVCEQAVRDLARAPRTSGLFAHALAHGVQQQRLACAMCGGVWWSWPRGWPAAAERRQ